ncbi:MAG: Rossmann-like domain-containing protein [Thermodesulfobacteriota bacterium]
MNYHFPPEKYGTENLKIKIIKIFMKILLDLIASLQEKDNPVKEILAGAYWTAVVSKGCGLAATVRHEGHPHPRGVKDVGHLTEKTAGELANYALSDYPMEASIGMAAINSLIEVDINHCVERNALEILFEKGEGQNVAIIGHFPFIPELRKKTGQLWVFEERPQAGDLPPEKAREILPQCAVVGITASTFINHTLEDLLAWAKGKYVLLIGPTTPMTPLLFDYGIQVLAGVQVVNQEEVFRCISQGATFREIRGVRRLTMMKK